MKTVTMLFLAFTTVAYSAQVVDFYSPQDISKLRGELPRGNGSFASRDLEKYPKHHTMLAYRKATGSAEIHEREADVFVVEEGDASIITGGKIVGGHTQKAGEMRGTSIEGGTKHSLKTGDIVHIPAGVAHQILVPPGKTITYFVVKVSEQ